MGVPENIAETGEMIYNEVMSNLSSLNQNNQSNEYKTELNGDYHIADYSFNKVQFFITVRETTDPTFNPTITGFQVHLASRLGGNKILKRNDPGFIKISVMIAAGNFWTLGEILDIMRTNEIKIKNSFTHELKHAYDGKKTPSESFKSHTEYEAAQSIYVDNVMPINEFFHFLYFIHRTEDLVRSSQFYSDIKNNKITKSKFKEFFDNNEMILTLRKAKNFNLANLKSELQGYLPQIQEFLAGIREYGIDVREGNGDEETIDIFLDLIYRSLTNGRMKGYVELVKKTINPFMQFIGLEQNQELALKQHMIDEYIKDSQKYKNYQDFFGNEAKLINFAADKTLRKLSKLYDMAENDNKSSIVDWDLHHEINKTGEKTLKEVGKLLQEKTDGKKNYSFIRKLKK